jgi:iron complex transport system permease protein
MKPDGKFVFRIVSFIVMLVILAACIVISSGFGAVRITPDDVISLVFTGKARGEHGDTSSQTMSAIFFNIRLPRIILGCLVGMTLAVGGVVYQALFRNPLADPYLIGVSSGASFGATLAICLSWTFSWSGFNAVSVSSFCGGLTAVFAIYAVSRVGKTVPVTLLVLSGVAIGSLLSAGTTFLMFTAQNAYQTIHALGWLFGSFANAQWSDITGILPYLVTAFAVIGFYSYRLNVLELDDQQAHGLGVNVERTRLILIIMTTLAVAAAVSVSGVIGFVGLIVPHAVRLVWGSDHRFLLPMSGLAGAVTVVISDSVARSLFAPRELPLGVITAFLGAPFFIYLLRKQKKDLI